MPNNTNSHTEASAGYPETSVINDGFKRVLTSQDDWLAVTAEIERERDLRIAQIESIGKKPSEDPQLNVLLGTLIVAHDQLVAHAAQGFIEQASAVAVRAASQE